MCRTQTAFEVHLYCGLSDNREVYHAELVALTVLYGDLLVLPRDISRAQSKQLGISQAGGKQKDNHSVVSCPEVGSSLVLRGGTIPKHSNFFAGQNHVVRTSQFLLDGRNKPLCYGVGLIKSILTKLRVGSELEQSIQSGEVLPDGV